MPCIAPPSWRAAHPCPVLLAGTLLSRNLFSTAYNYAATDGNERLLRGLDRFHSARAANCSAEARESAQGQHEAEQQGHVAQTTYLAAASDVSLMRACLDASALDVAAAAAGLQTYLPLRAVLASDACNAGSLGDDAKLPLRDGIYNCTAIADCDSTCEGPSRTITATFCQRCVRA